MILFEAIEAGNAAETRALLAEDPSRAGARHPSGVSAVLWARYRGKGDVLDAILAADPPLDVFDAAALGDLHRLADHIVDDPAAVNAWSADGFTPVGLAAFFGQPAAVRMLVDHGADVHAVARNPMRVQPLHAATAAHDLVSVRILLEAGADPNAEQQEGWTPLMAARGHDDADIVALLLAHGARDTGSGGPQPDSGTRSSTS